MGIIGPLERSFTECFHYVWSFIVEHLRYIFLAVLNRNLEVQKAFEAYLLKLEEAQISHGKAPKTLDHVRLHRNMAKDYTIIN